MGFQDGWVPEVISQVTAIVTFITLIVLPIMWWRKVNNSETDIDSDEFQD
jgi:hypothetical protein